MILLSYYFWNSCKYFWISFLGISLNSTKGFQTLKIGFQLSFVRPSATVDGGAEMWEDFVEPAVSTWALLSWVSWSGLANRRGGLGGPTSFGPLEANEPRVSAFSRLVVFWVNVGLFGSGFGFGGRVGLLGRFEGFKSVPGSPMFCVFERSVSWAILWHSEKEKWLAN